MPIRALPCYAAVAWLLAVVALPALAGPAKPQIQARAAVLIDTRTQEVIYAKNPHLRLPPASTTKVLTALLAMEHLQMNRKVRVSPGAANTPPSRIGLRAGERLMAQDLLYGLLLKSGNDAGEVVAEAVSGSVSRFAKLMNQRARKMGARNTHFRNPHGLPAEGHYSSAYDLAVIFRKAMRNPLFAEIVRTHRASLRIDSPYEAEGWRTVAVRNSNRLLGVYAGARGGKTGYTRKAKRCFVGEAARGNTRLVVAVLGSPNSSTLWSDVETLFDYGFAKRGLGPASGTVAALEGKRKRKPTGQGG